MLGNSFLFPYEFLLPHLKKGDPRDWVGTTVPCPWTRSYCTGSYDLEFAASAALRLVSRSRASLSLLERSRRHRRERKQRGEQGGDRVAPLSLLCISLSVSVSAKAGGRRREERTTDLLIFGYEALSCLPVASIPSTDCRFSFLTMAQPPPLPLQLPGHGAPSTASILPSRPIMEI